MIVIDVNLWMGSTTADWLQAIAALIAAVGVVVALLNINSDQEKIQSQINSLATLANESTTRLILLEKSILPYYRFNSIRRFFEKEVRTKIDNDSV